MMRIVLSVRVSDLTMTMEMPKHTAAPSTIKWPGLTEPALGLTMTITPISPSTMEAMRALVIRSPRKDTARIAVQMGVVNSTEISTASGMSVSA